LDPLTDSTGTLAREETAAAAPSPAAASAAGAGVPRTNWLGWTVALGSTAMFSISPPIAARTIAWGTDPTTAQTLRLVLTTALLFVTLVVAAPARLRIDRRGLIATAVAGVATGAALLLFFWSLTRLDTSIAAMLFSLFPLVVLVLLALRGEPLTYRHGVRLALGLAGLYLLIGAGGRADLVGVLMVLGAVLASSAQTVLIQWYLQEYDGLTVTFYMVAAMTGVSLAAWLAQGAQWHPPTAPAWAGIVVMAVVSTFLARVAMFAAIQRVGGVQVALLVPLETLLTVVWSVLFLGERLNALQALGSALILLSAALAASRLGRVTRWRPRWRTWWRW
jgi:drug/metabolite transporter (DMT)-like permease